MKYLLSTLCLTIVLSATVYSQKRSLQISDFANWKRIESRKISNDGNFVAYEIKKQKGDGVLLIYNAVTQKTDSIQHGYQPEFSAASDFVAFRIRLPEDSLRKLKVAKTKKENMPKEKLGIFNLKKAELSTFADVKSFDLPSENSNFISFLAKRELPKVDTTATDSTKTAKDKKKTKKDIYDLTVLNPVSGTKHIFNAIDTFSISAKSGKIAFLSQLNDSNKMKALVVFDTETAKTDTLLKDSLHLRKITFDEKGLQIAWLASGDTAKNKNFALYYSPLKKIKVTRIADTTTVGLKQNMSPSENGNIYFSPDGSKLYFGVAQKVINEPKDSLLDDEKPRLDLWSHTDMLIQPRQLKEVNRMKKQTFMAVYRTDDKKLFQIADSTYEQTQLHARNNGDIALVSDRKPYLRQSTWSTVSPSDYAVIDLKKGKTLFGLKEKSDVQLSASGKYLIWYDHAEKQYFVADIKTQKTHPVTQQLRVSITDELHDTPNLPDTYGIAGWTEDDKYVLVYDRFDIWKIDPKGKENAQNITNGRETKKRFRYISVDPEQYFINLNKKLLLSSTNEDNWAEGFFSLLPGSVKPEKILEVNESLINPAKARNAEKYLWSSQTVKDYPEIRYSTEDFTDSKVISETNSQQKDFVWSTVESVEWVSFAGDTLRGLLYKPEDFDPSQKYPMMVYFYERSSETIHRYNLPQPSRSIISIPFYNSNGYLVFVPDIVYRDGYPGQSAYDAIVSGVQKLSNTRPYINSRKIGLQGQSWGGYQIAYLVTQTNIFAAAMAGAPVSNMTSAYGGIRWGTGMSRMFQYEETQSRIGGTLWDKPMHYIENSPVFMAPKVQTPLLMMHNDNDGAVPWYQGIEYFMALYRLGKPVWMLNYNGMEHNIESQYWANRVDLSRRMFGFFNHYLKDMPAPEWMQKGIPAIDKGKKTGY